jgi:hypothetical protein
MLTTTRFPEKQQSRIEWWGRVILRQETARVPLAQFCRPLGITPRTFYYWTQRLRQSDTVGSRKYIPTAQLPRSTDPSSRTTLSFHEHSWTPHTVCISTC